MGRFKEVRTNNPNSLLMAVFANQVKMTPMSKKSSMRMTTALPGTPATVNSGDKSMLKIMIPKAISVLTKVMMPIITPQARPIIILGGSFTTLLPIKRAKRTMSRNKNIALTFIWPGSLVNLFS